MRVGTGYLARSRRAPSTSAADPSAAPGRDRKRPFPIRRCTVKSRRLPKPQVRARAVVSDRHWLDAGRDPARRLLILSPVHNNSPTADPLARDRDLASKDVRRTARNAAMSAAPRAATQVSAEFSSLDPEGAVLAATGSIKYPSWTRTRGRPESRQLARPPAALPPSACSGSLTSACRRTASARRGAGWPAFRD